ncbi:ABC transporter ATP-binding protein [Flavonifractor sp. DFI.6.63]|uniref:ABC transporter ATP-binding protein n=1 Tax=Lawsonibacter hominis TaxID=2763053 RepID=A0A8J6JE28_9FIRM|nr:ABC transporter ATP-binding protein [Lawsonibacter sp.]MBC5733075.1 ABC transporter ATP-binding protein [Lawsonibacter hominis]MBS1383102.1 ABC transporter ATP-binding protein [Flavonifractor sp.]MCQ5030713.1 ABC transporter ATP-binding protein [Flavonifractor sp. DFI.6.63]MDU2194548.1 ABC transporter ATP-binding protein [Clostridiales bacterium]MDY2978001.1 ABC transporter ATP-binding protein [Oscillospiraceae bacterium]
MLNVEGLSVCYGPICAVRKIDLQVRPGEIVALIGANGAGKSTLINAVLGLQRAKSGTITFLGQDITRWKTEKVVAAGISVVPEGRGMLADMTVLENLQLGAYHHKGDYGPMLEKVFSYFPILNDRKTQKAGTLSGGEQQMLAISRALMGEPRLVLLDEPSLALSPAYVDKIFRFLVEMKRQGLTILLSEQNARKALQYADRGYVLDLGVTVMEGPARQLADDPEVRRAYLGGE